MYVYTRHLRYYKVKLDTDGLGGLLTSAFDRLLPTVQDSLDALGEAAKEQARRKHYLYTALAWGCRN